MDVIDTIIVIAFAASFAFSLAISFLCCKTTDYVPGDATKAAEELVKQMNKIAHSIDWENTIETKPSPPATASCVTSAPHKRCAYCDTLNDHVTGVCDRCGAPLGEV